MLGTYGEGRTRECSPPSAVPPSAVPPSMVPPSTMPPLAVPPLAMPTSDMLTSAVSTSSVPTSAKPPSAVLAERAKNRTYESVAQLLEQQGYKTPRGNEQWKVSTIQAIENHEQLYKTGIRTWDSVQSSVAWPVLIEA